jgi:hypothetical protein
MPPRATCVAVGCTVALPAFSARALTTGMQRLTRAAGACQQHLQASAVVMPDGSRQRFCHACGAPLPSPSRSLLPMQRFDF